MKIFVKPELQLLCFHSKVLQINKEPASTARGFVHCTESQEDSLPYK